MAEHQHSVLVVDDNEEIRIAYEAFLAGHGCAVWTACEGDEALDRLRGGVRPCVILLDLMMPRLDGWQFRQAQLADSALAAIPVVAVSGYHAHRARAAASGIEAVLAKPVDPETLLGFVERYCSAVADD